MQTWQEIAEDLKFNKGKSWTQVADAVAPYFPELNKQQVWEKVRGALRRTDTYKTKGKVTFEDKKDPAPQSVDEYYEQLKRMNACVMSLEKKQTKATITIDDDKPIGVAHWGDWHIGDKGIDYDRLDEDQAIITETEGLYVVGMGDYKGNASALVHASSTQDSVATTDMQDMVVHRKFEQTQDKQLVIIRGCHDDWDKRNANKDFVQSLCDITGAVNLWHGGIINLTVGKVEYRIGARHKYKYESCLNTTNTQRNFMNEYGPCDVIAFAHKHYCDMQQLQRMGENVIYLRSGGYKVYDEFGQKLAGYEAIHGVPMVIYFPDKKQTIPFRNLEDGVKMLEMLRA
jgi:peptidyl-tRNA hydrolase